MLSFTYVYAASFVRHNGIEISTKKSLRMVPCLININLNNSNQGRISGMDKQSDVTL